MDTSSLYKLAVELAPTGIMAVEQDGTILLANKELASMLGYEEGELLGETFETLIPQRFRSAHPEYRRDFFKEPSSRPMGTGRDLYALQKNGSEIPVEIGLNPVQNDDQLVVIVTVVDISARKRADARFQAAVESAPSGMLMTDAEGTIVLVNREVESLFGYDRLELIGEKIEILIPQRYHSRHPQLRESFFNTPLARPMGSGRELHGVHKDGHELPVEIGLNPILTDEGACVLLSIIDISQRMESENRVRHSQKMEALGTLAGGIAHDFNNLLGGVLGYAELAIEHLSNGMDAHKDLQQIIASADRGKQLIEQILDFSRQRAARKESLNLGKLSSEALKLIRAVIPSTVKIHENFDSDTPNILADATQYHQILLNLATNASHAMPDGGLLRIELKPWIKDDALQLKGPTANLTSGLYARLSVTDCGAGMSEDVQSRIFEPFYTTKGPDQGTGLGLSIIHGIVENLGGAIDIASTPGEGTEVSIYFPASAHKAHDETADRAEDDVSKPHVLVVDDEAIMADIMSQQLDLMGYRVTSFQSSQEALAAFRSNPENFNLVITDNTMPGMTGMEMSRQLKKLRDDVPIVMVSGTTNFFDDDEVARSGIDRILKKPFKLDELRQTTTELISPAADPGSNKPRQ